MMSDKRTMWMAVPLALGLVAGLPTGIARAQILPIATNATVPEIAGGLAFDGTNYLVGLVSGTNVAGQRVSADGQLQGNPVVVGSNAGFPPAAGFAGGRVNALAAWSDDTIPSGVTMFGQLVSPSSGLIGPKFPLLAAAGSHGFQRVAAVASDGTNYLVVWGDDSSGDFYGQLVTGAGTLSGPELLLRAASDNGNVAAAFGRTHYLVAVQEGNDNVNHVHCRTVSPTGALGTSFQVSSVASLDQNPLAIGFDGTNFLVVWNHNTTYSGEGAPDWHLQGRLVSHEGTALGSVLDLVSGERPSFPALAFDGAHYLLAWAKDVVTAEADTTIRARFLDRWGNPVGPILTPFSAQGLHPPLLPLNGVLYDGTRFLLVATYGSFVLEGQEIVGFSGGDVYGTTLDRSTQPPLFSNPAATDGQFQVLFHVVPGQTYTIEISTNLVSWAPVGTVSSDGPKILELVDDEGIAEPGRLFYRAVVGNTLGATFELSFHMYAWGGSFAGATTPAPVYPVSPGGYTALCEVENELFPAAPASVFFTGPAGSGLSNTPADANNSSTGDMQGSYQSPYVSSPATPPGGAWVVNYKGTNITFTVPDPQAASRLVIPLPTVTLSGDVLQSVHWVYKDATTGATWSGAPSHLTEIQVQIDGVGEGRI
ncbi:MAG: hypothetical protein JXQ71_17555 [Verrucomicrobia bacterium]|nr:hypothetical protein [Verrucomicrobiota bacterium]